MTYGQMGGVSPGLLVGIGKAGYGITKAIGEHQTKGAIKIAEKRRREVEQGKRKRYAGELFYHVTKRIRRPWWVRTRVSWKR